MIATTKFTYYGEFYGQFAWTPGYYAEDPEDNEDAPFICPKWVDILIPRILGEEILVQLSRENQGKGWHRVALDGFFRSEEFQEEEDRLTDDRALLFEERLGNSDCRDKENGILDWHAVRIAYCLYGFIKETLDIDDGVPFYFRLTPA